MNLPNDQFSVKYYVARILLVIPYVKNNYKYLLLGAILGSIVGLGVDTYKYYDKNYDVEIVFTIENAGGETPNLGSFFNFSTSNESSNIFSSGNFEELVKMPFIYKKALLTPVYFNNKKDLFINYFIKYADDYYRNLKDKHYKLNANIDSLNSEEDNILNIATDYFIKRTAFAKENDKSSFRKVKVSTNNDTLSYLWANTILNTFSNIYIQNKTKKSSNLVRILEKRTDSLKNALYYTQGRLASFADQNQQIVFQSAKITAERLQLNSNQIQGLYAEAVRNLDSYKFSLAKETPLLNIIHKPKLPLIQRPNTFGIFGILGIFSGIGFSILILYFVKVYREVFND